MPKVGIKEDKIHGNRRLNPKQQQFLKNYLHGDMTQTAAAREAGYSNANVRAVQLLNNPTVKERLEEMRQELESKYGCLLYTSPSPRDGLLSRMPSSA